MINNVQKIWQAFLAGLPFYFSGEKCHCKYNVIIVFRLNNSLAVYVFKIYQ